MELMQSKAHWTKLAEKQCIKKKVYKPFYEPTCDNNLTVLCICNLNIIYDDSNFTSSSNHMGL